MIGQSGEDGGIPSLRIAVVEWQSHRPRVILPVQARAPWCRLHGYARTGGIRVAVKQSARRHS